MKESLEFELDLDLVEIETEAKTLYNEAWP